MSGDADAPVRLAELLATLSLGIDLGFSQPMEHVLRQCRIALRLADLVGLDDNDRQALYHVALMVNVGCHTDAHEQARWFGDDIAMKATKFDHEPFSAGDIAAMVRLLGSGSTPLHRIRAFDFAVSGRKEIDGMITSHARMARRLGSELQLPEPELDARLAVGDEREQLWQRWLSIEPEDEAFAHSRSVETPVVVFEPTDAAA